MSLNTSWQDDLILTGRGSTAIALVLRGLEKPGGQILVPANICEVVIAVIHHEGYIPAYADVDPITGNAEAVHFSAAWNTHVVALIATPNYGSPIAMKPIRALCDEKNLFMLEDLCNALGASYEGEPLGKYGDAVIYSFGYAKIIEYGIGGGLKVSDPEFKNKFQKELKSLPYHSDQIREAEKQLGQKLSALRKSRPDHPAELYNPLYASFAPHLIFQLGKADVNALKDALQSHDLDANLSHRREIASKYMKIDKEGVEHRPMEDGDIIWRYTLLTADSNLRDKLVNQLRQQGFLVSTWFPCVAELFEIGYEMGSLPGAEQFGMRVFNLFVDHRITKEVAVETVSFIQNQLDFDRN